MIKVGEDELRCDLAETYQIYDYRRLPATLVASFAMGLRDSSRIKMKLSGALAPPDTLLLAAAVDRLGLLVWMQTKDAQSNRNRPKSIMSPLMSSEKSKAIQSFKSGEAFELARQKIIAEVEG